ncbi:MAG: hypothetical protein IJ316_04735 [Clostridia bacterium]|nr:hypothetical protein [Clostridia bacterium]
MGNIREWSNIFDLLYGTEFFSAVIYDDENEWYEVARTYSTEDWEDDKKIARMEAAEEYHARKKEYGYIYNDKLYKRTAELALAEGEFYTKHEDFAIYEPFGKDMPEMGFFAEKMMREDFWTGFENEESTLKEERLINYFESGQSEAVKSIDSIKFVGKSKIDRILDVSGNMFAQRSGNVKIEVTNNNTIEKESDIESISDRLTEHLYEMMSRGADGLY